MDHIYEDMGIITGEKGLMTHMLPRVFEAIKPWLQENVTDPRFWDNKYDPTHTGEFLLPEPTYDERALMFERYKAQPNPFVGKNIAVVKI